MSIREGYFPYSCSWSLSKCVTRLCGVISSDLRQSGDLEFTEFLCAIMYVMGGAYASVTDAHIKVDVFYSKWSPKTRALVDLFVTDVVFFFFCGVLVWESGVWAWEAIAQDITTGSMWDPPVWPLRVILFLGSVTLFLQGCR